MPLFSRGPALPALLPLGRPSPDGGGWPDESAVGRPSFESRSFAEMARRHAYDPEAHAVADRLVEVVLPRVPTGVSAEDEPYLRKVFLTGARLGAGVAVVERSLPAVQADVVDRRIAAALWEVRRGLPAMSPDWARAAAFFVLAGFHVARGGPDRADEVLAGLAS